MLPLPLLRPHPSNLLQDRGLRHLQCASPHRPVPEKIQEQGNTNIKMPQLSRQPSRLEQTMPGAPSSHPEWHPAAGNLDGEVLRSPSRDLRVGESTTLPQHPQPNYLQHQPAVLPNTSTRPDPSHGSRLSAPSQFCSPTVNHPPSATHQPKKPHSTTTTTSVSTNTEIPPDFNITSTSRTNHNSYSVSADRPSHRPCGDLDETNGQGNPQGDPGTSNQHPGLGDTLPRGTSDSPSPSARTNTPDHHNHRNTATPNPGEDPDHLQHNRNQDPGNPAPELTIIQWNVQGIARKAHLLQEVARGEAADVFLLQETLAPPSRPITLRGYTAYNIPRTRGGSHGLCVLIKNAIPSSRITDPPDCGEEVELIAVRILLKNTPLDIYTIYKPPNAHLNLGQLFSTAENNPSFIAGDFNSHHPILGSTTCTNPSGRHIGTILPLHPGIKLLNNKEPTHLQGGVLDLAFVSTPLRPHTHLSIHPHLASDHFAIKTSISIPRIPPPHPPPPRWNTQKADWTKFRTTLQSLPQPHSPDLDTHARQVTGNFTTAAKASIPLTTRPHKLYKDYWFRNNEIIELNRMLNRARKMLRNHPSPENKANLRDLIPLARDRKATIREEKWVEWCKSIDAHTPLKKIWSNLRSIKGKDPPPPPFHPNPEAEADRLATSFAARTHAENLPPATRQKLTTFLNERIQNINTATAIPSEADNPITPEEIKAAYKTGADTSPGNDKITHSMIKQAGEVGIALLLPLFNLSLTKGRLPSNWKKADIVPIPKPKDTGSFRPISLLSCVAKTMERIILKRLQWVTGPLHPAIFAYRQGSGTPQCLATLLATISSARTIAVFVDLEKAFELADPHIIADLLVKKGVKGQLLKWVFDFLQNRQGRVLFQGRSSPFHSHERGTPQGSVLSPYLFNILIEALTTANFSQHSYLITYADDITIVNTNRHSLQNDLHRFHSKCQQLGLKINFNKTKAIAFNSAPPEHPLFIGNNIIDFVPSHQYLGVWLDTHLNFNRHINYLRERLDTRLAVLKSIGGIKGGSSHRVRRLFFTHAVRSLVDYCAPCLAALPDSSLARLETKQNIALRSILGAPPWTKSINLRAELTLPPLKSRVSQMTATLVSKMHSSSTCHTAAAKIVNAAYRDWRLPSKHAWKHAAGEILRQTNVLYPIHRKGQDLPHPAYSPPPPWNPTFRNITGPWLPDSKASLPQPILKQMTLEKTNPLAAQHDMIIYTDGSVDQQTGCAGAAFYTTNTVHKTRISNHASTLQTELVAILKALHHCNKNAPCKTLILTDSLAAIDTLRHPTPPQNNVALVTEIHAIASSLLNKGGSITIHWIPSHVGIKGNEAADKAAKEAAHRPNIDLIVHPSNSMLRRIIKTKCNASCRVDIIEEVENGSPSATWYLKATDLLPPNFPPHTPVTTKNDLHRLRLGFKTSAEICDNAPEDLCIHCEEWFPSPLLHYILDCPVTHTLRNHCPPERVFQSRTEKATYIIKNTPDPLLLKLCADYAPPR